MQNYTEQSHPHMFFNGKMLKTFATHPHLFVKDESPITAQEKRKVLKTLSNACIETAKLFGYILEYWTINRLLFQFAYNDGSEYKSFNQWKSENFYVRKHEKAFLLWGSPINYKQEPNATNKQKDNFDFFPLAYVFSNKQVKKPPIGIKQPPTAEPAALAAEPAEIQPAFTI